MTSTKTKGIVDISSEHTVDETVEKLKGILESKGVSPWLAADAYTSA